MMTSIHDTLGQLHSFAFNNQDKAAPLARVATITVEIANFVKCPPPLDIVE